MVVRSLAAPTPQSNQTKHSDSHGVGVRVGENVLIAPGSSIKADSETPFYLGDNTTIQDGVVIRSLEQGRIIGSDGAEYAVWIGKNTCITHLALIHGPAYIGDDCFIGFRSTIFNARIGSGCIVMMHTLIQDVEIPPGKYVPSGAIITSQEQAGRLPNVKEDDRRLAAGMVEINLDIIEGYQQHLPLVGQTDNQQENQDKQHSVTNMSSSLDLQQVRSLLSGGSGITLEYANKRRFKTKSWLTGGSVSSGSLNGALDEIETFCAQHQGEYVRIVGVDPQAKRRVAEIIVQRPEDALGKISQKTTSSATGTSKSSSARPSKSITPAYGSNDTDVSQEVRSLLASGYQIGIEHANARRFKTKSWLTGPQISTSNAEAAIAKIQSLVEQYQGEYVRLIGIDPQAKRRVAQIIIQRPGEQTTLAKSGKNYSIQSKSKGIGRNRRSNSSASRSSSSYSSTSLSDEALQQVRSLLKSGYQIGTEHADKRRFKTKSWKTCSPIESSRESEVVAALEQCIAEHQGEYVRMFGIDPNRRRVNQTIIQRPDESVTPRQSMARYEHSNDDMGYSSSSNSSYGSSSLSDEALQQVRSLLKSGYQIGTEHADKRRFKTKSWKTCSPIDSNRESEVIAALEQCIAEHQGEYVRMFGIDTKQQRRVNQTIIQRPDESVTPRQSMARYSDSNDNYSNGNGHQSYSHSSHTYSHAGTASYSLDSMHLSPEALEQVRSLIANGYQIGTEHADKRRFRAKSWQSCSPIETNREPDVVAALEDCLQEHSGEYVRIFGIDPQHKRRISETIIQRP